MANRPVRVSSHRRKTRSKTSSRRKSRGRTRVTMETRIFMPDGEVDTIHELAERGNISAFRLPNWKGKGRTLYVIDIYDDFGNLVSYLPVTKDLYEKLRKMGVSQ